jgi:hypothetical protein
VAFRKSLFVLVASGGAAIASTLLFEHGASAQIHGDFGVNLGAMDRVRSGGTGNGDIGPIAEVEAHIAVLPLLRVGFYVSHDIAPNSFDKAAWQVTSGGLHLKILAPWIRGNFRAWFFAGFGYAGVYAPSYNIQFDFDDGQGRRNTDVTGAGGSFFEVPFGFGGAWKFAKPWELTAQLGARFNFLFSGSLYDYADDGGRTVIPDGGPVGFFKPIGNDNIAPFLMVGIAYDR